MKALVIADRTPTINIDEIRSRGVEIIITLGDLDYFDLLPLQQISNIPKIGVYGNHCSGTYLEKLGILNMHLKTTSFKGLTIGGFEGSVRYKPGNQPMYTQEENISLMQNFPYVDVFISHAPPYGINDEPGDPTHEGFRGFRRYLEEKHPKVWLHGHTYPTEENIVKKFESTRIEYVFRQKYIDI
jgi:Icc-related predicted phosphoesterase